jgi:indoleamine 2,3-dioxygenase
MPVRDALLAEIFRRHPWFETRGFLPLKDPLTHFPEGSPLETLDHIGRELPDALNEDDFRYWIASLEIPHFIPTVADPTESLRQLNLYCVRTLFILSAYANQIGQRPVTLVPKNIAVPAVRACRILSIRPILPYKGYALDNWERIDAAGPIALGNIATIQNFVSLKDEPWFILVHVEIEAIAAAILAALARYARGETDADATAFAIRGTVEKMTAVLRRIPEHMSSDLYFKKFRPYIMGFFEGMVYEGVSDTPMIFRGETGAQSSIMPLLEALLKIPHAPTGLTAILSDMRNYMPSEHRMLLGAVDRLDPIAGAISKEPWNALLEAMAEFRSIHLGYAVEYIDRFGDGRGTGGSPYIQWLSQLRDETLAAKKSA